MHKECFGVAVIAFVRMVIIILHMPRPETDTWVEWHRRPWRQAKAQRSQAWGGHTAVFVSARAVGGVHRCLARSACSVTGCTIRWLSSADVDTVCEVAGDHVGHWRATTTPETVGNTLGGGTRHPLLERHRGVARPFWRRPPPCSPARPPLRPPLAGTPGPPVFPPLSPFFAPGQAAIGEKGPPPTTESRGGHLVTTAHVPRVGTHWNANAKYVRAFCSHPLMIVTAVCGEGASSVPRTQPLRQTMEPDKCKGWKWASVDILRKVPGSRMFLPMKHFLEGVGPPSAASVF